MKKQKVKIWRAGSGLMCLAGIGVAGALLATSCSRVQEVEAQPILPDAPSVAVAKATRQDLERSFKIAAEFRPYQEINVYAKVSGYVKHIDVDIGDRVRTGRLLAVLEIPELTAELDRAQASLRRDQEELKRAQGDLQRAQAAHQVTHLQYGRLAAVAKQRPELVAQQEIDDAQGRDLEGEAKVAAAKSSLAAAQEQLQIDQATLQKDQSMWDYSRITAPFNGVITKRYVDNGAMVASGISSEKQALPVVQLAQTDLLRLDIPVPEADVPKVRLRTPVEVYVQSINKTFPGLVARISGQVDMATRTMIAEVDVPNADLVLVPGMYAEATITLDHKRNAVVVPVQAVSRDANKSTVLMVDAKNKIAERTVTLGLETSNKVEIVAGINEGDMVVIGSRGQLQDGMTVKPKMAEGTGAEGKT